MMNRKTFNEINNLGLKKDEIFFKFKNDFVRNKESRHYFEPNSEGQLEYIVFISLLYHSNMDDSFDIRINKLVKSIGYKPRTGVGNINDKVKKAIERLEEKRLVEIYEIDKTFVSGDIILPKTEEYFFKCNMSNIFKIMNDLYSKLSSDDYANKYNDKGKAIYVYTYLISMMGNHRTTEGDTNWYGCFPSFKQICKDCNVSESYLLKLLAYFEYDGLIYTSNLGQVSSRDGVVQNSSNYYTNDFSYLSLSRTFAKAYCDKHSYSYAKYKKRTGQLLDEITEMLQKRNLKLDEPNIIKFKEHLLLMIKDTINNASKVYYDINMDKVNMYIGNKEYLDSKFYNKEINKILLFIADNQNCSIELLTHIRNKIKAMLYMYEIIK